MSFLNNTAPQRQSADRPGRGRWERPSVRRQLAQKKAAIPASPGSGLLRKTREAER